MLFLCRHDPHSFSFKDCGDIAKSTASGVLGMRDWQITSVSPHGINDHAILLTHRCTTQNCLKLRLLPGSSAPEVHTKVTTPVTWPEPGSQRSLCGTNNVIFVPTKPQSY